MQHIDEVKKQENRDLTRFDLDFDLPDHFLPEFPAPIFLTTRPDLGDVSQGKLVTIENFYELFNGILNPKQLEGLRLLVTPFPQQQFNQTGDRRSERPSRGVVCFECHANRHTNAATHLVGDIRPQEFRHRIGTPSLRGVNIQRVFGSQRALKSVEDFTEFEQRAAYFDGDPVLATKKGVNILDRGSQVHDMAEFQELLDFPPAPKLDVFGRLDARKASQTELRGEELFFGSLLQTLHSQHLGRDQHLAVELHVAARCLQKFPRSEEHESQRRISAVESTDQAIFHIDLYDGDAATADRKCRSATRTRYRQRREFRSK